MRVQTRSVAQGTKRSRDSGFLLLHPPPVFFCTASLNPIHSNIAAQLFATPAELRAAPTAPLPGRCRARRRPRKAALGRAPLMGRRSARQRVLPGGGGAPCLPCHLVPVSRPVPERAGISSRTLRHPHTRSSGQAMPRT